MTPEPFIAKWRSVELKERSAAPSHVLDLCELLGEPKPTDADRKGAWYGGERRRSRPPAAKAGPMWGSAAASGGSTRASGTASTTRWTMGATGTSDRS